MKKSFLTGLLVGLFMLLSSMGISMLLQALFPALEQEYARTALFRPWSDPLMFLIFIHPFVVGFALAWAWSKVKETFHGSVGSRGAKFGLSYWIVATIPGMLISYSSFQVSFGMVLAWTISGLISAVIAGLIFAKWNK